MDIHKHFKVLGRNLPDSVIEMSVIIIVLGVISFIAVKGIRKGFKYSIRLLLANYAIIILCSTVIFRKSRSFVRFDFTPFRTYYEFYCRNSAFLLTQAIMNIVIFIPIGLLLKSSFPTIKWWKLLLMGTGLSLMIEFCQLALHKGFCEFDDVMHNTIGCMLGLLCYNTCCNRFAKNQSNIVKNNKVMER